MQPLSLVYIDVERKLSASLLPKKTIKRKEGVKSLETDEQLYCTCQQVSYGEMIACDNKVFLNLYLGFFCFYIGILCLNDLGILRFNDLGILRFDDLGILEINSGLLLRS